MTTGIWISNAAGNWGTATNWSSGIIPQGNTARARFDTLNITTNVTVTNEVARTIVDLEGSERVSGAHLAEALSYRVDLRQEEARAG